MDANTVDEAAWENFKTKVKEVDPEIKRREAAEQRENERRLTETFRGLIEADNERPGEFR